MYTMLNYVVSNNIHSPMHNVELENKGVSNDEDECIICYERSYGDNQLLKGSDIFDSACNCNYMVHRGCINMWLETQNQYYCICCNSVATFKPIRNTNADDNSSICCNLLLVTFMTILTISFVLAL